MRLRGSGCGQGTKPNFYPELYAAVSTFWSLKGDSAGASAVGLLANHSAAQVLRKGGPNYLLSHHLAEAFW